VNTSSLHTAGRNARRKLEEARESLAADLGAQPGELVFTSGGTEANNLALLGAPTARRPQVAISAVEHPSVAAAGTRLAELLPIPVHASGHLDLAAAAGIIGPRTGLVSVMWVNNESGAVQPIPEVVALARDAGALVHSDSVQAFGHLAVDFGATGLDLISVSAHKLGGPVGIGALVVRRGVQLVASGFGGGQEARLRSGTVPVALAAGFAAASRVATARVATEAARLAELRDRLITGAQAVVPGCVSNTIEPCGPRSPT
jgi:cysteine desulfurase